MRRTAAYMTRRVRRSARRAFNLVELLIALSISAALLTATMVALDACFMAYQSTTEVASTHTIGRLTLHRMLALIRNGQEFGPLPADPQVAVLESDFIQFVTTNGDVITLEWNDTEEALYVLVDDGVLEQQYLLLEGVIAQFDADGNKIFPFTLEYELGRKLHRATIDMAIIPDDNMSVNLDGDSQQVIRLVASAMPRLAAYAD